MKNLLLGGNGLPDLVTVETVAEYFQISLSKAYQLIREGSLPSVVLGRCIRVKASDLAEYVQRSTRYEFEG